MTPTIKTRKLHLSPKQLYEIAYGEDSTPLDEAILRLIKRVNAPKGAKTWLELGDEGITFNTSWIEMEG